MDTRSNQLTNNTTEKPTYDFEYVGENIDNKNVVFQNLRKFPAYTVINTYVNDEDFTEKFILDNMDHFNDYILLVVKQKKPLSDNFLKAVSTKTNYCQIKTTRKLLEPLRNYEELDNLFY